MVRAVGKSKVLSLYYLCIVVAWCLPGNVCHGFSANLQTPFWSGLSPRFRRASFSSLDVFKLCRRTAVFVAAAACTQEHATSGAQKEPNACKDRAESSLCSIPSCWALFGLPVQWKEQLGRPRTSARIDHIQSCQIVEQILPCVCAAEFANSRVPSGCLGFEASCLRPFTTSVSQQFSCWLS